MSIAAILSMALASVVGVGGPVAPRAPDAARPTVTIVLGPDGALPMTASTVDELTDGDVLVVTVRGGPVNGRGTIAQCAVTSGGLSGCRNTFPVVLDDDGAGRFQYQVRDAGECGPSEACVVHVAVDDREGDAFTVFGAPAPAPPGIALSPAAAVEPGSSVGVTVTGVAPGSLVRVAFCGETCGGEVRATASAAGTAVVDVSVPGRCSRCGIAVVAMASRALVPVAFSDPPAPRYDPRRLAVGLGVAAGLSLLAWWIIASVDWRPPSEAATPDPP